jgi:hypothetical protein
MTTENGRLEPCSCYKPGLGIGFVNSVKELMKLESKGLVRNTRLAMMKARVTFQVNQAVLL